MQRSLFSRQEIKQVSIPKTWSGTDAFPFGIWKGKTLNTVAAQDPDYLEWWIRTKNIRITAELRGHIQLVKFLNR